MCFDELCKQTHIVFDHLVQFICVLMSTAKQEYIVLGHVVEFHLIYRYIFFKCATPSIFTKFCSYFCLDTPHVYMEVGGRVGGSAQLLLC